MKRLSIVVGLLVVFLAGAYYAYESSQLYLVKAGFAGSYAYGLLFKTATWVIPLAVFGGILAAAVIKRPRNQPEIQDGKVLRHDEVAFFMHWTHAFSTVMLLVTGVLLGFLIHPRLVQTPEAAGFMLNLHYVGVVIFLFGLAYYLTETFISGGLAHHMPDSADFQDAIGHYAAKFGIGKPPREGKYLASEKLSYPGWIVIVAALVLTGAVKVSAHVWNLPGGLMEVMTFVHDLAAVGMLAMLAVHIIMAAVLPWSWPLLRSMLTGYVPVEYVRKHHVKWYEEMTGDTGKSGKPTTL